MICISQSLQEEVPKEMVELSGKLVDQLNQLNVEGEKMVVKQKEIEERIWLAHEANRRAIAISNDLEARETALILQKAKGEKRGLRLQESQKKEKVRRQLEFLNAPLIEQVRFLIDGEIVRLHGQRILKVTDTKMTNDPLIQGVVRVVQTNRRGIDQVRMLFLTVKEKVCGMCRSSIQEILQSIEVVEEEVNTINLKQCDEVQMRDSEYHDELALIEGERISAG